MVSNNGPPLPMPMQVPPGHMVQQIVDENGVLTHVILSPQPPGGAGGSGGMQGGPGGPVPPGPPGHGPPPPHHHHMTTVGYHVRIDFQQMSTQPTKNVTVFSETALIVDMSLSFRNSLDCCLYLLFGM